MSDEALFVAYCDGDENALEMLIERIREPLFRTIVRNVGDVTVAEDVFQDTVERIIRHRSSFDRTRPFRGWAWKIAINRCFDHLRRKGRELSHDDIDREKSHYADPETIAANREILGRVGKAVRDLPDAQREVFLMREEASMTFAQIAEATGKPLGTVLSRMNYAMNKLRDAVEE